MNSSIPPSPAPSDPDPQYAAMRRLLHATAVSVLILSGTVFVFLYRQVVLVRRQTAELSRYVNEVDRSGMSNFVEQVRIKFDDYRKTHPDFAPIYNKYWPGEGSSLPNPNGPTPQPPGSISNTNR
jgi:hypothetical protein